jgi:hypothetical protein
MAACTCVLKRRRFKAAKVGSRHAYDFAIWLLAARLARHDFVTAPPTRKQRGLLEAALHTWVATSVDQLLSQLLLQLLLLARCVPGAGEMQAGAPEACAFVSKIVAATAEAAAKAPGELVFAAVQLSFVLTSAQPPLPTSHSACSLCPHNLAPLCTDCRYRSRCFCALAQCMRW